MAKASLGRLEPVAVREVWPNEESDFTPWLAEPENLGVLADALGMSLEFVGARGKGGAVFSRHPLPGSERPDQSRGGEPARADRS